MSDVAKEVVADFVSLEYEAQKRAAMDADAAVRRSLAADAATVPEILYFLASDHEGTVRVQIAQNQHTPHQADLLLARDRDENVRAELAQKIARLAPTLSGDEHARIRDLVFDILRVLAADQLPRIRARLSEALKAERLVPPDIIRRLALDAEAIVANPVLEFSPLLTDDDLLLVIEEGSAMGRLTAIARREGLTTTLTDALAATLDESAIAALLGNGSAQIREETLDAIVDSAKDQPSWHEPLILRPLLPLRLAERLVNFVANTLMDKLLARAHEWQGLDADAAFRLKASVNRRLQENAGHSPAETASTEAETEAQLNADARLGIAASGKTVPGALDAPEDFAEKGSKDLIFPCTDEQVEKACLNDNRTGLVASLAAKTGMSASVVMAILGSAAPRAITALAWQAGLTMRTAMRLQLRIARIPATKVLNAKDGVDYPLSEAEMKEALLLFT